MSEEKALVPVKSFMIPAFSSDRELVDEMDGITLRFDRVKVPSGGSTAWEVPSDDPENPEITKALVGIILDHYPCNAYWSSSMDDEGGGGGTGNPPDCYSLDGKVGVLREGINPAEVNFGGSCEVCPLNKWGSDPKGGKGKACKNTRRVFFLRENEILPLLLIVPPSSLDRYPGSFGDYISKRVIGKGRKSYEVITKMTLKRVKNARGIDYSQIIFSLDGLLPEEQRQEARRRAEYMKRFTRAISVTEEDVLDEPVTPGGLADEDVPF